MKRPDSLTVLALAAVLWTLAVSWTWLRRDDFLSREEAQHVLRALGSERDLRAALLGRGPWRSIVLHPPNVPKPYYGFPYYFPLAAAWRLGGVDLDRGVLLNAAWLVVLLAGGALLAARLSGDAHAAAPAVLALAAFPGTLVWSHVLGPDVCVAAAVALAAGLLVAAASEPTPAKGVLAGLGVGLALVVKPSNAVLLLPPILLGLARLRRSVSARAALLAFSAAVAPACLWLYAERDALYASSSLYRGLYGLVPRSRLVQDSLANGLDVMLPGPGLLVAAAATVLGLRGDATDRRRAAFLVAWLLVPPIAVCLATGFVVTPHNQLPALVPAAALMALAAQRVTPRVRHAAAALLLLHAIAYGTVLLGGRFASLQALFGGGASDAAIPERELVRATPLPDLLTPFLRGLERHVPPGAPSRCGCLPFPPYPVTEGRDVPVVLVDGQLIGPENLNVWTRVRPGFPPRVFGYVPYGLSAAAYRTALDCASAVAVVVDVVERWEPLLAERKAALRPALLDWVGEGRTEAMGGRERMTVWLPEAAGLCQTPDRDWPARVAPLVAGGNGGAGDYYALHLEALAAERAGGDAAPLAAAAARLAAVRRQQLESGLDPAAMAFGELPALAAPIAEAGRRPSAHP